MDEQSLKDLMGKMFDNYRMSDKLEETGLHAHWEELMGRTIAKNTRKLRVNKGILFIEVDSPALKNDLIYYEKTVVDKVNQFAGRELITSIKVK